MTFEFARLSVESIAGIKTDRVSECYVSVVGNGGCWDRHVNASSGFRQSWPFGKRKRSASQWKELPPKQRSRVPTFHPNTPPVCCPDRFRQRWCREPAICGLPVPTSSHWSSVKIPEASKFATWRRHETPSSICTLRTPARIWKPLRFQSGSTRLAQSWPVLTWSRLSALNSSTRLAWPRIPWRYPWTRLVRSLWRPLIVGLIWNTAQDPPQKFPKICRSRHPWNSHFPQRSYVWSYLKTIVITVVLDLRCSGLAAKRR